MLKLSIITVVFDGETTIRDCIESVLNQNVPVEHIIIDGHSTDSTLQIIQEYKAYLEAVISEKDNGIYDGMNKGLKIVSGDVVGILNADDMYAGDGILKKVVNIFEDENIDACYGDLVYVDPFDTERITRYWRSSPLNRKSFYWGWMPPHPTFFVRKSVYKKYGLFNLDLGSAADYELMLRFLLKYKINATYIPETLVKMRVGGASNASLIKRLQANRNDRLAWKVNDLKPYPWTLFMKPLRKINQWFPCISKWHLLIPQIVGPIDDN